MDVKKPKSIVIYSGGLDSTCLLYRINKTSEVLSLIFNYGQRHSIEIERAIENCVKLNIPYKVLDISFFKDIASSSALLDLNLEIPKIKEVAGHAQPLSHVPNRNMIFLSIAAAIAESIKASSIYYGAAEVDTHSGNWDCSLDFLKYINQTLNLNRSNQAQVVAPYITFSKADIIKDGVKNGVDFTKTHTCYNGKNEGCLECSACSSRVQGFIEAGYIDPKPYLISDKIPWTTYNCKPL
jgi:7-cyano-7-deazaguanine synthase